MVSNSVYEKSYYDTIQYIEEKNISQLQFVILLLTRKSCTKKKSN